MDIDHENRKTCVRGHGRNVLGLLGFNVLVLHQIDALGTCGHLVIDDRLVISADDVYPKVPYFVNNG